ncbi:MAG: zinc ribbon domain-containing protein [Actinobacteria bacterium]|jgi:putative FmdB family regulatory protein|nr:zinc ribbon domain-containing protein [Actinomycetota bacterium]
MATYDLRCRSCGRDFEVFVLGFLKDETKVCPDCGSREVEQRFTGFGGVMGLSPDSRSGFSNRASGSCAANTGFS